MSAVTCTELDLQGKRSYDESLSDGATGKRTFIVYSNDIADTEPNIRSTAQSVGPNNLPAPFSYFPGSTLARAHRFSTSRSERDRKTWVVVVEYKTIFNQQEVDRQTEDPTSRPIKISGTSRTVMKPVRKMLRSSAYNSYPSTEPSYTMQTPSNSAGDPLDPPIYRAITEWELHCEKNVSTLPSWYAVSAGYNNGVNNADQNITIRGVTYTLPKGCAKISNLTFSDNKKENDVDFITLTWNVTILTRADSSTCYPWDEEIVDAGMRTRSSGKWVGITDKAGQYITSPVPFDGSGSPLASSGSAIPDSDLWKFAYRPNGPRVDFSAITWT